MTDCNEINVWEAGVECSQSTSWGSFGGVDGVISGPGSGDFSVVRDDVGDYTITFTTAASSQNNQAIAFIANAVVAISYAAIPLSETVWHFLAFRSTTDAPTDPVGIYFQRSY